MGTKIISNITLTSTPLLISYDRTRQPTDKWANDWMRQVDGYQGREDEPPSLQSGRVSLTG